MGNSTVSICDHSEDEMFSLLLLHYGHVLLMIIFLHGMICLVVVVRQMSREETEGKDISDDYEGDEEYDDADEEHQREAEEAEEAEELENRAGVSYLASQLSRAGSIVSTRDEESRMAGTSLGTGDPWARCTTCV